MKAEFPFLISSDWYAAQYVDGSGIDPKQHYSECGWKKGLSPHPLFNPKFYANSLDSVPSNVPPLTHYATVGWKAGGRPSIYFDVDFYLKSNPDVANCRQEPLSHYLLFGWREGRRPHPLFDVNYYLRSNPDVVSSGHEPLGHYIQFGWREGRRPHPLFDAEYYLLSNPDLIDVDPLMHYLEVGFNAGRSPHPLFNPSFYLAQAGPITGDPLTHYLMVGSYIGLAPNPFFDPFYYREQNPDLPAKFDLLTHYLSEGWREGRKPHPLFEPTWYRENYLGSEAGCEPLSHYLSVGRKLGARPNALFDTQFYVRENEGGLRGLDPAEHYATIGWKEGRNPHPLVDLEWLSKELPQVGDCDPLGLYLDQPGPTAPSPHPLVETGWYFSHSDARASDVGLVHMLDAREASGHPLFDSEYYRQSNGNLSESDNPLLHYLDIGWREGRSPHPLINREWIEKNNSVPSGEEVLGWFIRGGRASGARISPVFDEAFYLRENLDVSMAGVDPLFHFMEKGWRENRSAHWLYRNEYYAMQYPDVPSGHASEHYCQHGWREGREISPAFDSHWYRNQIQGSNDSGEDWAEHYRTVGYLTGLSPHPCFDVVRYSAQLDSSVPHQPPLQHYMSNGRFAGLSPHSLFDPHWYAYGVDLPNSELYLHFLAVGDQQGRSAHPLFDPTYYRNRYPESSKSPMMHYIAEGARRGLQPNPMFDPKHYAATSDDPASAALGGLIHYTNMRPQGRRHPHPLFDGHAIAQQIGAVTVDPLELYLQVRSKLDTSLVQSCSTGIPGPLFHRRRGRRVIKENDVLISVLLPTYNSPPDHLRRCIEGVRAQTHQNWELIVVDDGSPNPEARDIASTYALNEKRIRAFSTENNEGISKATNRALMLAKGEFVALLDHDDILTPDALGCVIEALLSDNADVAYTDQAYISEWGTFDRPFHKPAWSPALLAGVMYVGHLLVVRRTLATAVSGFDGAYNNLQDFEFMLRISEQTNRVTHVPEILYHWRQIPGSIASDANAKGAIGPLQASAVNAHFRRTEFPGHAKPHSKLAHRIVISPAFSSENNKPSVMAIVRGDRGEAALKRALKSLAAVKNVMVVGDKKARDKRSHAGATPSLMNEISLAVARAEEDVVIYLDPLAVPNKGWLDYLLMYLAQDDVAMAAPHFQTKEGIILAAGSVMTERGVEPAMKGLWWEEDGHAGSLSCDREVSALNGYLVGIKRSAIEKLKGFDSMFAHPTGAFADLALRARLFGFRNIAVSGARAVMAERSFASESCDQIDEILLKAKHKQVFELGDPFFNKNFDCDVSFPT